MNNITNTINGGQNLIPVSENLDKKNPTNSPLTSSRNNCVLIYAEQPSYLDSNRTTEQYVKSVIKHFQENYDPKKYKLVMKMGHYEVHQKSV